MYDTFNGDFWLAVGTAGPVIALAHAVTVRRSTTAALGSSGLRLIFTLMGLYAFSIAGFALSFLATDSALRSLEVHSDSDGKNSVIVQLEISFGLLAFQAVIAGLLIHFDRRRTATSASVNTGQPRGPSSSPTASYRLLDIALIAWLLLRLRRKSSATPGDTPA